MPVRCWRGWIRPSRPPTSSALTAPGRASCRRRSRGCRRRWRTGRSPTPAPTRIWRSRRRSMRSASRNSISSWRTTGRRSTACRATIARARSDDRRLPGPPGRRDQPGKDAQGTRPAGRRQQAQHAVGAWTRGRRCSATWTAPGSSAEGAQRDLAALIAERNGYIQELARRHRRETGRSARQTVRRARSRFNKAQLRRQLVELRADTGWDGVDDRQGLGRVGADRRSAVHHPGAGRTRRWRSKRTSPAATTAMFMSATRSTSSSTPSRTRSTAWRTASCGIVSPDSFNAQDEQRNPTGSVPVARRAAARCLVSRRAITLDRDQPARYAGGLPSDPRHAGHGGHPGRQADRAIAICSGETMPLVTEGMREP